MNRFQQRRLDDVDEQANSISAWQQAYLQLSDGPFHGQLDEICSGQVQLFHEYTSLATWQQCQPWRTAIWFGLPSDPEVVGLHYAGRPMSGQPLLICPAGQDFDLRTPGDFGIFGLVVDQAWLGEVAARHGLPCQLPAAPAALPLSGQAYWHLGHHLRLLLAQPPDRQHAPLEIQTEPLLVSLLRLLASTRLPSLPAPTRHWAVMERARALIADEQHGVHDVQTLARRLYLTRRTLQNLTQETLGITPLALIHAIRLQALRRDLRDPAQAAIPLAELASRHDFWHAGQLAQSYRRHFGEGLRPGRR
ncbi:MULTISPECIES: helix-turn-helix domain-containing protein [unclassified Paludibacterium]|uniref:helix-turn-helix domain-containing protein n=1 Tax=unclassified Paludibacterium TaxID=2618429 RepID=UPI001C05E964|nr:helix-turn-helix domain-containing protein [Paludibacterium sp. B53371]BEV73284.1 HTH-type transcriptional regulator EutR [Paludibacterium sp. THUN1379]